MSYSLNVRQVQSVVERLPGASAINFGTDLNSEPAFLNGVVTTSVEFAAAMNVLGNVVRLSTKKEAQDHSAYQAWVEKQYVIELLESGIDFSSLAQELVEQSNELQVDIKKLELSAAEIREDIDREMAPYNNKIFAAKRKYWRYLYQTNRELWVVLDPIVSVQKDGTFFEAFSLDESVYARVFLPHSNMASMAPITLGTTNIDFSSQLNKEFRRVRSYRPLNLQVGQQEVSITTQAQTVIEEKIPLPETWVQGLVEVQSVLSLATTELKMSSDLLAEIIARLESEVESHGPRSLKFILTPNEALEIEIEPWGEIVRDPVHRYDGTVPQTIRIWGRRRLSVLKEILPAADTVHVTLLGSGMPSFWTVIRKGVELTVGLSGWSSNDWASRAKFSSFVPTSDIENTELQIVKDRLLELGIATTNELANLTGLPLATVNSILQKLCLSGKAMYHPSDSTYRWRNLFPELKLDKDSSVSTEERLATKLKEMNVVKDETIKNERHVESVVDGHQVQLKLNSDGRPTYAQCNCSYFAYNKLKAGPCRHMIFTLLNMDKSHD